jgi:hypothetical protein
MTDISEGRRRANQPTSFEQKTGFRPVVRRSHSRQKSAPYAARSYDPVDNVRANGNNRSYAYLTNADMWNNRDYD